ncbi:MAG: MFS transporter [Fimbriimonadales bacterium]
MPESNLSRDQLTLASRPSAPDSPEVVRRRNRVLWLSFSGFTLLFGAWTMFGVLGVPIRKELGLSDEQLAWLTAVAILNGAVWRLALGVLSDRLGGKVVFLGTFLFAGIASFVVGKANTYPELLLGAFLVGIAGNSFAVGSAWCAAWFPKEKQGFAMGLFGAGNVGASITKFIGPGLMALVPVPLLGGLIPGGWRFIPFLYSVLIAIMATLMWWLAPRPDRRPSANRPLGDMLRPLREMRVWRFSLYYTVVFGAYVAMSVWLPKYYVDVYGLPLSTAALLTTPFILASSLLRPFGGYLSDRFGPRRVTYVVFTSCLLASAVLFLPLGLYPFAAMVLVIGIAQGIGKASTIKYIPEYYPLDVGAVVGLVGALAALGGFIMPPLFAYLARWSGSPQSMFWVIFAVTGVSLIWLHAVVRSLKRAEASVGIHAADAQPSPAPAAAE